MLLHLTYSEKFWSKVTKTDTCWLWTGGRAAGGYGVVTFSAHRLAYELTRGSVPQGLELDHICKVRLCVNPAHLEPVSRSENSRRRGGGWKQKAPLRGVQTVCRKGHPLSDENLYVKPNGMRQCRACRRLRERVS